MVAKMPLSSSQKTVVAQFMAATGAPEKVAQRVSDSQLGKLISCNPSLGRRIWREAPELKCWLLKIVSWADDSVSRIVPQECKLPPRYRCRSVSRLPFDSPCRLMDIVESRNMIPHGIKKRCVVDSGPEISAHSESWHEMSKESVAHS